jgi:hypothetical protein
LLSTQQRTTGGGGTNQIVSANFVAQWNSADAATSGSGLEIDLANNKSDDVLNPATSVSHYGLSIINGGSKIFGPAAISIQKSTAAFRRALQVNIGTITSDGFLIDYAGPGTGGVFQVDSSGRMGIGTLGVGKCVADNRAE